MALIKMFVFQDMHIQCATLKNDQQKDELLFHKKETELSLSFLVISFSMCSVDGWGADKLLFLIYLYLRFMVHWHFFWRHLLSDIWFWFTLFQRPMSELNLTLFQLWMSQLHIVSTTNVWTKHCFNCTNVQVQKRQTTHVFCILFRFE